MTVGAGFDPPGRRNARVDEIDAWSGMLRVHSLLTAAMSAELEAACDLNLSEYEVLLHIHGHPEGRASMGELANSVILTPSGITRLVDRLVKRGLVARQPCPHDARVQHAVLTDVGAALFVEAGRLHLSSIHTRFLGLLGADETEVLTRVWKRLLGPAQGSGAAEG